MTERVWDVKHAPELDRRPDIPLHASFSLSVEFGARAVAPTVPTRSEALQAFHNGLSPFDDAELPRAASLLGLDQRRWRRPVSPTPRPALVDSIIATLQPRCVIELGVYKGGTSTMLARALDRHGLGPDSFVLSVDTWLLDLRFVWGQVAPGERRVGNRRKRNYLKLQKIGGGSQMYIEFLHNVLRSNLTHRIVPMQSTTLNANHAVVAAGFKADAIYVDASHGSLDVLVDLEHWWPLVRCGGVMCAPSTPPLHKSQQAQRGMARFSRSQLCLAAGGEMTATCLPSNRR